MNKNKRLITVMFAAILAVAFVIPQVAHAKLVKKVDNFIYFVDQSGSMAEPYSGTGTKKIEVAKQIMNNLIAATPELGYQASAFAFAPFQALSQPGPYNKSALSSGVNSLNTDYDIFGRNTPMGNGILDLDPAISATNGRTALIIFTDGASNIGLDPIAQAKAIYARYGDRLCIHVVSFADTPRGEMVVNELRALSRCSVNADAGMLMSAAGAEKFAQDVFYKEVADPKPAPVPVPVPAPAPEPVVISFNLHFGFDKYGITEEMVPVLEQVSMILEENPAAKFEIAGHTDATGTEEYNQGLSERRANSVRSWLVEHGIAGDKLEAVGYGELQPKFDNTTREGRRLNRRVDITSK